MTNVALKSEKSVSTMICCCNSATFHQGVCKLNVKFPPINSESISFFIYPTSCNAIGAVFGFRCNTCSNKQCRLQLLYRACIAEFTLYSFDIYCWNYKAKQSVGAPKWWPFAFSNWDAYMHQPNGLGENDRCIALQ